MSQLLIGLLMVLGTLLLFLISRQLYIRYPIFLFNPVLFSTFVIIILLISFKVSYSTYMIGGEWINHFLSPVVVALAYPLYKQREILAKYFLPIISGMLVGILASVYSGLIVITIIGHINEVLPSLVTKNITTAIALQVTEQLGGSSSLTAVFVMIAGFTGIIVGPLLIKLLKLKTPLGRGIAFGSASHAIGTTKAFEYDSETGSISSAAMILTAIFASIIIPILI